MNIERMQALTKDLIAIDSVTGNEGEITDFLVEHLESRGLATRLFEVDGNRRNILAHWQHANPTILFNTHTDTVPRQYGPHEDDARIYGRGACDTHGILAAQLEAIQDLKEAGLSSTGILLVVGEETTHDGALHAGISPEIVMPETLIVGEPTENKLMTSQKGRLKADLTVYGIEGHSGYPEKFDSAVKKLFLYLNAIWQAEWLTEKSDDGTTVNVILLPTNGPDNQIPPAAKARVMFRLASPSEEIRAKLEATLGRVHPTGDLTQHYHLEWLAGSSEPITHLSTVTGFKTGVAAYNTDIHYFGWHKAKTFLLGPGSILQAHRDLNAENWLAGEWILKKEQIRGVELYKNLVRKTANFN